MTTEKKEVSAKMEVITSMVGRVMEDQVQDRKNQLQALKTITESCTEMTQQI